MDGQVFLRTTKIGNGFEKKDVLAYVDELNTKIYNLENKLKEAEASVDNSGNSADLSKMQDEIKNLKKQLDDEKYMHEQARKKVDDQKNRIEELSKLANSSSGSGDNEELLMQIKQKEADIEKKNNELQLKETELSDKERLISEKDSEISRLNSQIEQLKNDSAANSGLEMSNLFIEAEKTVQKYKSEAKNEHDKIVADANAYADRTVSDANEKAQKIIADADAKAQQTLSEAVAKAEAAAEEDRRKAAEAVAESLKKANEANGMAETVRANVKAEVDSVFEKLQSVSEIIAKLADETNTKINDAKNVIQNVKADSDDVDKLKGMASELSGLDTKSSGFSGNTAVASKPADNQNGGFASAPKKNNFDFDLEALTKAVEEEAAAGGNFGDPISAADWDN